MAAVVSRQVDPKENLASRTRLLMLGVAVRDFHQRGDDEALLLRARYLQLVQALLRTREHNPGTLAALMGIVSGGELPRAWLKKTEKPVRARTKGKDRRRQLAA